jgi:hypothetical protein
VFGEWQTSEGCGREITRARELCIPIRYENGECEIPKMFYCTERADLWGNEFNPDTVPAWDTDGARKALGCVPSCETMCGCGGPAELHGKNNSAEEETER